MDAGRRGTVFEARKPVMWDSSTDAGASTAAPRTLRPPTRRRGDGEPGAGESGKLAPSVLK